MLRENPQKEVGDGLMRICYIANSASSHTEKWVSCFVNLGYEVHVISHSDNKLKGATVHYINYSIKNFIFKVKEVHKLIKEINPDILHAHQANTCGLYAVTYNAKNTIVSAWGSDVLLSPERSLIMKKIVKYVLKKATFITSDSYYMSEKIIELGGNKEKIFTFPMGIEDDLEGTRHEYDVNDSTLRIISTRRLEALYNIDIVIKGFHEALKENHRLSLTIAADGTDSLRLKELVKDLSIADKVNFTGRYDLKQLGNMLSEHDVFISIPKSDSTSVSLLEAMYCGVFSVVCDLPANKEWIVNGDNGLIIPQCDPQKVKEAILWCSKEKQHMKNVSQKNIDIINQRALWKNNSKIVDDLYKQIFRSILNEE
jgi:glycosyltransferase involved in cell wall biosynthesis